MTEDTKSDLSVIVVVGGGKPCEMQEYLALESVLGDMQIPHQVICIDHEPSTSICDPRVGALLDRLRTDIASERGNTLIIGNHRSGHQVTEMITRAMVECIDLRILMSHENLVYQKGHNYPWYHVFNDQRAPKVLGRKPRRN